MKIGITGTQDGATDHQLGWLRYLLVQHSVVELHHGDCIGADEQAHAVALELGLAIVIHPPVISSKRARCGGERVTLRKPLDYLVRNRNIVDETDAMIALPKTADEQLRSGTWSTVRYARRRGKTVHVIPPTESAA